jgi:hypothetical protein
MAATQYQPKKEPAAAAAAAAVALRHQLVQLMMNNWAETCSVYIAIEIRRVNNNRKCMQTEKIYVPKSRSS